MLRHEADRSARLADCWESEIAHPAMQGPLNLAQLTLASALGYEVRIPEFRWQPGRPRLGEWFGRIAARPSFRATVPPAAH